MASRDPARVGIADRVDCLCKSLIVNGCFCVNCSHWLFDTFMARRVEFLRFSAAQAAVDSPESAVHRLGIVVESGIGLTLMGEDGLSTV